MRRRRPSQQRWWWQLPLAPMLLSTPYGPGTRASGLLALWMAAQLEALKFSAFAALERTLDDERDNEWIDGWQEAGELDEARAAPESLRTALR